MNKHIQLREDLIDELSLYEKDYLIKSFICFLPQSQLEELKDSIDREVFQMDYILHDNQKEINSFFEIAKTKDPNFANNINDYMFMYRSQNQLYFKHINTRKYLTINYL